MISASLARLLAPRSVAVVGVTDRPGTYGRQTVLNLRAAGYRGRVHAVHPRHREVLGVRCAPTLAALDEPVDAVVVAVPAPHVLDVVRQAGELECGGVVVYASGFAESPDSAEGVTRQRALADLARSYGLALCGPNGNGIVSVPHRAPLWGDPVTLTDPGPVALITQSGNLGVNALAVRRWPRLHTVISCGNQAVLTAADYLDHLADTPGVGAVALYLEADGDGARLAEALARCAETGVGVVVLKAGRSAAGAAAGAAHTAALAGDHRVMRALVEEAGATWVHSPHELLEIAGALAVSRRREGGVAIITCSGGDAAIAADEADRATVALAPLTPATRARLAELLPAQATVANPLDFTSHLWARPTAVAELVRTLGDQPETGHVLAFFDTLPGLDEAEAAQWHATLTGLVDGGRDSRAPLLVAATLPDLMPEAAATALAADRIAPLAGLATAIRAVGALQSRPPSAARLREIVASARATGRTTPGDWYAEHDAKELLRRHGISVPESEVVADADAALVAAQRLGWPVAVKLSSPQIRHKTAVGALAVDIADPGVLLAACGRLFKLAAHHGARVLVERMAAPGVEVIVAAHREGVVPCLVIGLGGAWAEVLADVVVLPLPVTPAAVRAALARLRGAALLTGPADGNLDVDALADLAVATAETLLAEDLHLLELNPVLVSAAGAVAVDAVARRAVPRAADQADPAAQVGRARHSA